jgi:hypothetical protein
VTVRLKLSQLTASAPAHLGEFNTSGLAGMIAPVHDTVGLLSETVPDAGVALCELDTSEIDATAPVIQNAINRTTLSLSVMEMSVFASRLFI